MLLLLTLACANPKHIDREGPRTFVYTDQIDLAAPPEVAWALCAGADAVNSARGFMFALGCIQAMKCNKNTCPTGITTHDPRFHKGLDPKDKSVRVANYAQNLMKEVSIISHSCGVPEPRRLKRYHARVVTANGLSVSLSELHPDVATRAEYA